MPYVHGPCCFSTRAVGPIDHFPLPRNGSDVVGSENTGPSPQTNRRGTAGERNIDSTMSLVPAVVEPPDTRGGWLTNGRMNRVMRFHSEFSDVGMTG